jgi:hypothetical protein
VEKAKDANIVGILVGTLGVGMSFLVILSNFVFIVASVVLHSWGVIFPAFHYFTI